MHSVPQHYLFDHPKYWWQYMAKIINILVYSWCCNWTFYGEDLKKLIINVEITYSSKNSLLFLAL